MDKKVTTHVYAMRLKDETDLFLSSSGGAFTAISDTFLNNGDLVIASHYDYESHQQVFGFINSKEIRNQARGSKYVKSIPGDIYNMACDWLQQNKDKSLVFFGLGCQVDGFRKFLELKGLRERACLVDIICTGGVSPKVWKEYIKAIECDFGKKIDHLTFKDKMYGWKHPLAVAIADGREASLSNYVKVFNAGCALMPCCHRCPYTTAHRNSDITIGDYWGIEQKIPEFYDKNGVSLILLHTESGRTVFEKMKLYIDFSESNIEDCMQPRLKEPTPLSDFRGAFWKEYKEKGVSYVINKYSHIDRKASTRKNRFRLALYKLR